MAAETPARLGIDAVVVGVRDERPHVLTFASGDRPRLPSGPFEPARDRTLELATRRVLSDQAGLREGYLEQLYTFGDRRATARSPGRPALRQRRLPGAYGYPGGGRAGLRRGLDRLVSFLPLGRSGSAGRPAILDRAIAPLLRH